MQDAETWSDRRVYPLTIFFVIAWPILSIVVVDVFIKGYFAFWIMISKLWGFGAALIITCLPLSESAHDAQHIIEGIASSIVSYVMNVSSIDGEDHDRSENVSGQQKKSICIHREKETGIKYGVFW